VALIFYLAGKTQERDWRIRVSYPAPTFERSRWYAVREELALAAPPPLGAPLALAYGTTGQVTAIHPLEGQAAWRRGILTGPAEAPLDRPWPLQRGVVLGAHDLAGPYLTDVGESGARRAALARQAERAISRCDVLFAWLDGPDFYWTLAEIGFARARDRLVWVAGPQRCDELWRVYEMADLTYFGGACAADALRWLLHIHERG
jgi:hypothetical protein